MNVELEFARLAENKVSMDLFKKILKSRMLSKSQLMREQTADTALEEALQELKDLGLINESISGFNDFNKYYPTKAGLEMEKMVK